MDLDGTGLVQTGSGDHAIIPKSGSVPQQLSMIEQEALERKIKQGKGHEFLINAIKNCSKSGSVYLDLSVKGMPAVPTELLSLPHVQNLYLEGNYLKHLPEDFFQKLPNLKWLDLRNNSLVSIPSAYIGSHLHLSHLLLQGNQLQTLPLELGLVTTLVALNIASNPLKFPPQPVLDKGVVEILAYLKQVLLSKTNGTYKLYEQAESTDGEFALEATTENGIHTQDTDDSSDLLSKKPLARPFSAGSDVNSVSSSEVMGKPIPLQKQVSYKEFRQGRMERIQKAGAAGRLETNKKNALHRRFSEVNVYPEPPSADLIDKRMREQQLQAIAREKNEKVDAILQRRKDEDRLKKFRDEAKAKQRQKEYEKYLNGGKLDFVEPATQAPFDVVESDMKVITNEERIKKGVKEQHERIRRVLSPRALKQMEQEKAGKERELRQKIKDHTEEMKQRRKKPKGSAQEEMDAAVRELEIAKRLQQELDRRRRNLDYRFKAYNPPP